MQFEVIKHGDMFLVTNRDGNIPNPRTDSFGYGLFLCDTRGVSRFEFETSIASLRLVHCDASTNVERRYRLINVDPIPSTDDREIPLTRFMSRGYSGSTDISCKKNVGSRISLIHPWN